MKTPTSLFDAKLIRPALVDSLRKLDPRALWENPVMLVTEIGAMLCTVVVARDVFTGHFSGFNLQITLWLWFTVLFANFAEALAEGRGKAQAESLKKARTQTLARRLRDGGEEKIAAPSLQKGDTVVCETGDVIPADGEVIEGIASVDEAAIGTRTHDLDTAAGVTNPAQKGERRVRDVLRTETGRRLLEWGVLTEIEVGREKFLKLTAPKPV